MRLRYDVIALLSVEKWREVDGGGGKRRLLKQWLRIDQARYSITLIGYAHYLYNEGSRIVSAVTN